MQQQLSLPYEEITSVAGRTEIRKSFKISSQESYKVPISQLVIRDGYNKRRVYEDMENCVQWVIESTNNGIVELDPAPVVDFVEKDGQIIAKIMRGHRRYNAIKMAIAGGLIVDFVVCSPTPKGMTELDRLFDIYSSNMHQSQLKPIEQAAVVYDAKHNFGVKLSNEEIAKKINCSRQKVDYLLMLAEADDRTKDEIKGMNLTDAVAFIRGQNKASKQADKVEVDANKTSAAPLAFPKDELAGEIKKEEEEARISNYIPDNSNGKDLNLVGNQQAKEKREKGEVNFDESREEIALCQNLIKNIDWLSVQSEKLPDQTSKDFVQRCSWLMKDAELIREWVSKNKKQNKIR